MDSHLNESANCPCCTEPVSGEAVTLWDDRIYCRECVEEVSPALYEFVIKGGRLEETVEKSDVSISNFFNGAGVKYVITAFLIFMFPFLLNSFLDDENAQLNILIGFLVFCSGFVIGYILLKLLLSSYRRTLPRKVTVESGELLVIRPQGETRFPLAECKWKFGGVDRDGITYFTGLQKGITINCADYFISCGHLPEMLKYWGAFLILAGVRRKSYWAALRIFYLTVSGSLVGFLMGWGVGHLVALLTNNQIWIFSLGFLGAFDGFGTALNYAYYTSYGAQAAHKRMNPGFLGGAFSVIGFKVGIISGPPIALLCAAINGALGVIVAWLCRSWIEKVGRDREPEFAGLVRRELKELSEYEE